jgi:hypothetical protein
MKEVQVHANFIEVSVDLSVDPERKGLHEGVIPRVRQLPGLVAGYWLDPVGGSGMSLALFETEESARGALESMGIKVGSSPAPGVTVQRIETREVIGHT